MKILVLGASGFIGNFCLNYFASNHSVQGVDITSHAKENILADNNFSLLPSLIKENQIDVVLNCAGSSNVLESFNNPDNDFTLNTVYLHKILTLLKNYSPTTKLITISSASVYGNPQSLPVNESNALTPLSPYAFHKLLSDQIVEEYARLFNIKALSVRIFSAYGPGLRKQFFFDLYSKFIANPKEVNLPGTGNESRDFIYISDIAAAFNVLINHADFNGEVYNLGSEVESFILPTAKLFAEICQYKGEINFTQNQFAGYPLNWKADTAKLRRLGFAPQLSLEEGLHRYHQWIKNNLTR